MSESAHGWSPDQVIGLLHKVQLFEGLPPEDLRRLAGIVKGTTLGEGQLLFEEGEPGDAFYIVFKGAVEIVKSRPDGTEDRLAVRRSGEAFGEMALLDDGPRSATARGKEASQLIVVPAEDFQALLGSDSFALRMMRVLSTALRALDVRLASAKKGVDAGARPRVDVNEVSRLMQAGLLPGSAPRIDGFDVAAGTTTEEQGRGGSVWDWIEIGGRTALITVDVGQDGFPPAYQLGVARAVLRSVAKTVASLPGLLARVNDALADAAVEGLDQYVDMGVLVPAGDGVEWASAGRVPGGVIHRDGTFDELRGHGPPLGMLADFKYNAQTLSMSSGDTVFVLSHASQGLFLGAADLMAQLHGKPAGEVVSTLHKAIRKAQGDDRTETSVLYARKH